MEHKLSDADVKYAAKVIVTGEYMNAFVMGLRAMENHPEWGQGYLIKADQESDYGKDEVNRARIDVDRVILEIVKLAPIEMEVKMDDIQHHSLQL